MGYYSEVGLCLSAKGKETLDAALAEFTNTNPGDPIVTCFITGNATKTDEGSGSVLFHWGRTKWYHDFDEVRFVETFMNGLDHEEYLFLRVGEEIDDTEHQGGFWDNPFEMSLTREIAFGEQADFIPAQEETCEMCAE